MELKEVRVRLLARHEEQRFKDLMQAHHYLGAIHKVGETLWYVAVWRTHWIALGQTLGFRRTSKGYSATSSPKRVFVYPLQRDVQRLLSNAKLNPYYQFGGAKLMITAAQMKTLPDFFRSIADPRRAEGQRHRLSTILSIATGAILCGRVGYKGIAEWAKELSQSARACFNCRYVDGHHYVPSEYVIRNIMIRVSPDDLDQALRQWSALYGQEDKSLAIDGKVMRNAIGSDGKQTQFMSAIGHESLSCHTQKKSARYQ